MAATTTEDRAQIVPSDEEIAKLMGKGKVHLVCNEILDAVKCFEEATKKMDSKYGESNDKCADAYLCYGKSLLELARMEGGVIGNALDEVVEEKTAAECHGHAEASTSEQKPEEEKKEEKTEEKKPDDLIVGPKISEIGEQEKEQIGTDVQEAMTAEALDEAMKEDKMPGGETLEEMEKENKMTEDEKQNIHELKAKEAAKAEKKPDAGDSSKSEEKPAKPDAGETSKAEEKPDKPDAGDTSKAEENPDVESKDEDLAKKEEESMEEEKEVEGGEDEDADVDEGMEEDEGENEEGTKNKEKAAEDDEPTYMELAWQMIELARLIFEMRESKEGKLQLAQCHLKLGEIQMEQEQFMGAIEDFLKCLDIQKEHLESDNRLLAETSYNIGLSFSFQCMHEKAKTYYNKALEVLDNRMKNIQNKIDEAESKSKGKGKASDNDPLVANRKELEELQDLYPEIKAKVDEASDQITQKKADVASIVTNGATTTVGFGACSEESHKTAATLIPVKKVDKAPEQVSDISHLVHRNKRKQDEDNGEVESEEVCPVKKPRQENEPNGSPAELEAKSEAMTT